MRYSIEDLALNEHPDWMGMKIYFDKTVEVTASQKTIDTLTLLTRLGGTTGVGKEAAWFILLLIDFWIIIFKKIKMPMWCELQIYDKDLIIIFNDVTCQTSNKTGYNCTNIGDWCLSSIIAIIAS